MNSQTERLEFALTTAAAAREVILSHYQSGVRVDRKSDDSPVTVADRGAEKLMRDRLAVDFPEDGVLGEEFDETPSSNGYRWILDPIDGTKAFIHGVPLFGCLIGLELEGQLVMGVCDFPALDETVYAATGTGAWWHRGSDEAVPAVVSQTSQLAEGLLAYTEISGFESSGRTEAFAHLRAGTRLSRGWGDCYGHMLVATGRADVMVDPLINAWDAAALVPILREAGGHYTGWNGEESIYTGDGISTNGHLRSAVLDIVRPYAGQS